MMVLTLMERTDYLRRTWTLVRTVGPANGLGYPLVTSYAHPSPHVPGPRDGDPGSRQSFYLGDSGLD